MKKGKLYIDRSLVSIRIPQCEVSSAGRPALGRRGLSHRAQSSLRDGKGGKSMSRYRRLIGRPIRLLEFLRIPNFKKPYLCQLEPSPTSKHRRWQQLLRQSDHDPVPSSARLAHNAGEVLHALDARNREREKWRREAHQGASSLLGMADHLDDINPSSTVSGTSSRADATTCMNLQWLIQVFNTACGVFLELRIDRRVPPPIEHRRCCSNHGRRRLNRLVLPPLWAYRARYDAG